MRKYSPSQVRLLECWLPFAQNLNEYYAWGYQSCELERLILASKKRLVIAQSVRVARDILVQQHLLKSKG
jgi:primosomal replication protein N